MTLPSPSPRRARSGAPTPGAARTPVIAASLALCVLFAGGCGTNGGTGRSAPDATASSVELATTIVDVEADRVRELDIGHGGASDGNAGANVDVVSRVLDDAGAFLVRARALESGGGARIVLESTVVAPLDVETPLDHVTTSLVLVEGEEESAWLPLSLGTSAGIVPSFPPGDGAGAVALRVSVDDAAPFRDGDGVPRVVRSETDTKALVDEGRGLLIGGLHRSDVDIGTPSPLPADEAEPKEGIERFLLIVPRRTSVRTDASRTG